MAKYENIEVDPRRPGKYYVRIFHQGVRYRRRASSLSHAKELVHDIKAAIARGEWPPQPKPKKVKFDDLLDAYRKEKLREGKAVMDGEIGFKRLRKRFGGRDAASITTAEVKEWRDSLLDGHSIATVNRHLTILRAVLRMGVRDRRITIDALPEIEAFEENNERVRWLTPDEEDRLLLAAPVYLKPLLTVAIHTGLRKSELLHLLWSDIDFLGGALHVRESKSGEGRYVPMDSVVVKVLSGLRNARQGRLREKVVQQPDLNGYVFVAPKGGFLMNLNRTWYALLRRASLEGLHFHDLRHTFGSRLAMAGVPLYTISKLMGHKTLRMTERYAHLSRGHLHEAVELLVTKETVSEFPNGGPIGGPMAGQFGPIPNNSKEQKS